MPGVSEDMPSKHGSHFLYWRSYDFNYYSTKMLDSKLRIIFSWLKEPVLSTKSSLTVEITSSQVTASIRDGIRDHHSGVFVDNTTKMHRATVQKYEENFTQRSTIRTGSHNFSISVNPEISRNMMAYTQRK